MCAHCDAENEDANPFESDELFDPRIVETRNILLANIANIEQASANFEVKTVPNYDDALTKAIKQAKYVGVRNWSIPTKYDALLAVLGGPGGVARTAFEASIGANEEWKNRIPLNKKEWAAWVVFESTEQATSFIPGAGWLAALGGEGLKGAIIGGNKKRRVVNMGTAAAASSINQATIVGSSAASGPAAPATFAALTTASARPWEWRQLPLQYCYEHLCT